MGTRPLLEARPSLAARNPLHHDRENAEVEAIYHTSLRELVFRAQTVHLRYGAQTEVWAIRQTADGAQTEVCATTAERGQTRRLISIAAAGA
jgi:acyl-coenzyme A thioesterase PaaI-like protein